MREYLKRYSKFAGDPYSTEYDRWGGAAEQYAIKTGTHPKITSKTGKVSSRVLYRLIF